MNRATTRIAVVAVLAIVAVQALALHAMGRVWICTCHPAMGRRHLVARALAAAVRLVHRLAHRPRHPVLRLPAARAAADAGAGAARHRRRHRGGMGGRRELAPGHRGLPQAGAGGRLHRRQHPQLAVGYPGDDDRLCPGPAAALAGHGGPRPGARDRRGGAGARQPDAQCPELHPSLSRHRGLAIPGAQG